MKSVSIHLIYIHVYIVYTSFVKDHETFLFMILCFSLAFLIVSMYQGQVDSEVA